MALKSASSWPVSMQKNHSVNLSEEERGYQIDPVQRASDVADIVSKVAITGAILALFVFANYYVFGFIENLLKKDMELLATNAITPDDRIIDSNVIMALIAGTVAEIVTVLTIVARHHFR
ncbi:MAG: hypothetical protein VX464_22250 [Pseudomonadota bacterium]|nr:hypothetical protein [Pseudomonadota bacterium]